jgi:hypothetical protein
VKITVMRNGDKEVSEHTRSLIQMLEINGATIKYVDSPKELVGVKPFVVDKPFDPTAAIWDAEFGMHMEPSCAGCDTPNMCRENGCDINLRLHFQNAPPCRCGTDKTCYRHNTFAVQELQKEALGE